MNETFDGLYLQNFALKNSNCKAPFDNEVGNDWKNNYFNEKLIMS